MVFSYNLLLSGRRLTETLLVQLQLLSAAMERFEPRHAAKRISIADKQAETMCITVSKIRTDLYMHTSYIALRYRAYAVAQSI